MSVKTGYMCSQKDCYSEARWRVMWPGQLSFMCDPHKRWAHTVAQTMGFELAAITVEAFIENAKAVDAAHRLGEPDEEKEG